ncbi:MAG: hypothetical protein E5Y83_05725 [Mesorhizobium sp.]|nr:MAG: hypothetical protein E5Y83_05725 [Mesorhizobium sp.]
MSAFKIASVILSETGIVTKIIPIGDYRRPLSVPKDWHKRYAGTDADQGYFVLYDGGYASWSPSKEFEDGYTLIRDLSEQAEGPSAPAPDQVLLKRIDDLKKVTEIAVQPGNADADEYMRGMANGLILAMATMDGTEPAYIEPGQDGPTGTQNVDGDEVTEAANTPADEGDDLTFKSPLDVAELARGVGAAARFIANGGGGEPDIFGRDEAAVMADFVRDNPDAPVEAMFIHLGLKKRYPRTEPNTADLFTLSLFHAACRAAIKFEADQAAAEAAAKAKPEPSGGWPGVRALQPQKPALSPSGFSPR